MANSFRFKLGNISCIALEDNNQQVDIRVELGQVDEDQLLKAMKDNGYDGFDVKIGFNCLYLEQNGKHILIDCGTGSNDLITSMKNVGLDAKDIDYLVITHSDFDHIGGLDLFKKAKIVFPKLAYDLWTDDSERAKMIDKFKEVFLKFLAPDFVEKGVAYRENYGTIKLPGLKDRMLFVEPEEQFLPGIKMIHTPGHRPDHYAVEIDSDGHTLLHIADGFRHKIQVQHPDWYSRFDSYPEQMAESLTKVLDLAKEKNALLFGSHFQFPGLAKLVDGKLIWVNSF